MKILCTKKLQFFRADIKPNPLTGEPQRIIHESFTVVPSPVTPQVVPDWVQNDGLFDLAVQDGSLTVIGGGH